MFERLELLIGDKINDIKNKNILLIGIGGVGSYACESLIRSGIMNITIADNDIIDISNLNRQLMTNMDNIGKYKVDVMKDRILSINPNCKVKTINYFVDENNISMIFKDNYDYVIDACDSIDTKVSLIEYCINNNIKIISCMGTGNKMDPSKLEIVDLRKTINDPLARVLRKFVKDEKINKKIMVLSSRELPVKTGDRTPGSTAFVPASAGLLIASYVVRSFINK